MKKTRLNSFFWQTVLIYIIIVDYGVISTQAVAIAMANTDRRFYAPHNPYMDAPQSIGHGVTISAPHMVGIHKTNVFYAISKCVHVQHAFAMEYLRDRMIPGSHVLDVGSGSGYLTACFWRYIQAQGENNSTKVVGVEHNPALVTLSKRNLDADDSEMLKSGSLVIVGK